MGDTLARVLSGMAVLGILGDTALLWHIDRQVVAIQNEGRSTGAAATAAAARRPRPGDAPPRGGPIGRGDGPRGDGPPTRDEAESRVSQWRDAALDEVAAWGKDENLDQGTIDAVTDEIETTADALTAIRDDLREQRISVGDARSQIRDTKDASDARLDKLVGKQRADDLRDRLRDARPF